MDARVIRKYPNRRLYDTHESRYVSLSHMRRLVLDGVPFAVIDRRSGRDVTRAILLQVIAGDEDDRQPMLSQEFLAQVIRACGGELRGLVGSYLEQSLTLLLNRQQQLSERMHSMARVDWKAVEDQLLAELFGRGGPG